ncbi:hypothetical protein Taro_054392 [Colocasia esculenta]|uniref:Rab3GAP catalytic subunit conserved domain-containing protein n=1 Tax=Colocasia esculenta TaxID=4460 RepID=A0A843XQB1_COLES|nr:hypothetical protein [Colocasia esculenta]
MNSRLSQTHRGFGKKVSVWQEEYPKEGSLNVKKGVEMFAQQSKGLLEQRSIGNLWRELWETAKPLPAEQAPLFDEDLAVYFVQTAN